MGIQLLYWFESDLKPSNEEMQNYKEKYHKTGLIYLEYCSCRRLEQYIRLLFIGFNGLYRDSQQPIVSLLSNGFLIWFWF